MLESFFDVWSLLHIFVFFMVGIMVFAYSKKPMVAFLICMIIALLWEIFERIYLFEYVDFPVFGQTSLNTLSDIFVFNIIGFVLAYLAIKRELRR